MAENRVIGRGDRLPWHLPADLRRFKALTTGHTLIMGRKTFDTIGKPLPDRHTIVVTRDPSWRNPGVEVTHDLRSAIERSAREAEVFVAGGAEVYRQALPYAGRIYLTLVHASIEGDAHFPDFPSSEWTLVEDEPHAADERNRYPFSFRRYERLIPVSGTRKLS
jgi:dihydrofolate reductase